MTELPTNAPTVQRRRRGWSAVADLFDWIGRTSFGVLCVGGMAIWATPALAIVGIVALVSFATGGDSEALALWLFAWGASALAGAVVFVVSFVFWPLASDWIIEWPGYATALGIGAAALGLMAALLLIEPVPVYVGAVAPIVAAFIAGFSVPGRLLGLRAVRRRGRREVVPRG